MSEDGEPRPHDRIVSVTLDESTIARGTPDQEHERNIAIYDLIESNVFALENGRLGPYALNLGLNGNRLVFDLRDPEGQPIFAHVLALSPFRMVIKDYFMICASYYDAIRNATAEKIEAIDMARRGTHNEGAELVAERLKGKIRTDFDTSRRIFTLIAALVWTRPRDMSVRDMSGGDERTTKRPSSVLFACSMNAVRSPMAEGLAKSIVGRSIFIDSAGLNKEPLDMFALAVMREAGVDIAAHKTKAFDDIEVESFDLIIALSPEAFERAQAFARTADVGVEYWPTVDPTALGDTREQRLDAYRGVRDHLRRRITERLAPS